MKIIIFLTLLLLIGCATRTSLEELKDEEIVSGDWTKVESREKTVKSREEDRTQSCPRDTIKVCTEWNGEAIDCSCAYQ